ncbi:hypothetical protein LOD99_3981 [Oopsacas minuta]|uniref:Transposase n=1 Tax=Oopsacas minuta TaxID=111878 RepID=A0AAV7JWI6_9METZ|nr:hypothetical protein LOD99_3981 [Oopsacas minuta]
MPYLTLAKEKIYEVNSIVRDSVEREGFSGGTNKEKLTSMDLGLSKKESTLPLRVSQNKTIVEKQGVTCKNATGGLENIIFTDEKIFTIAEATNVQNDRVISTAISEIPDKFRYISRKMKPLSVMICAGVSAVGRTPLIFVPAGVKISAKTYKDLILEPVVKDPSQTMFSAQPFVFQQDGAPAHTAITTQDC